MNRIKFLSKFLTDYRDYLLTAIETAQNEIVFYFY